MPTTNVQSATASATLVYSPELANSFAAPTADLCQTGHAGFGAVARRVAVADRLEGVAADARAGGMRARAACV